MEYIDFTGNRPEIIIREAKGRRCARQMGGLQNNRDQPDLEIVDALFS
jgi:hypothetical protein